MPQGGKETTAFLLAEQLGKGWQCSALLARGPGGLSAEVRRRGLREGKVPGGLSQRAPGRGVRIGTTRLLPRPVPRLNNTPALGSLEL